ncbi:hypothetical protein [Zavarzinia sp. CC-PAN008]|uniref:hypothetical protein n=1 Tax=Zavarzinia sp. CC-PAN008 TaxID=3243332 RepID=UPI003F745925
MIDLFMKTACRVRGSQVLLLRREIRPADFRFCLSNISLVDIIDGGQDFRYRLVGETVRSALGAPIHGRRVTDQFNPLVNRAGLLAVYRRAAMARDPMRVTGTYYNGRGIVRPFTAAGIAISDDGATASGLLVCTVFPGVQRVGAFPSIEDEADGMLAGPFGPDFGTPPLDPRLLLATAEGGALSAWPQPLG